MTFLRPWLLLLILIPIVFRLFRERVLASSDWHKVIDKQLLPYLLIPGTSATAGRRSLYKIILWTLLSIGAAGPAWDKMPVPSRTAQPGTIIVLELSPAMSGENLTQARRKILDILNELKGEQIGLVLYDRFGYTAGPLTFETDIIRDMVPYLDQSLLPEAQFNPVVGFEQADKLFSNAGIRVGRILFLTSGAFIPQNMPEIVKKYDHEIGVLGIGPKEAHPIPLAEGGFLTDEQNKPVMVQLLPEILSKIGVYQPMTSDDTDIKRLLYKTEPTQIDNSHDVIDGVSLWQDRGAWFVLACLPLFALLFRKGIIMLLVLCFCLSAEASLWRRPDQEEYLRQIDAVRDYRRARYRIAGNTFKTGSHTDDWYNWGNALAFQKRIQEAIDAYKKVLGKDPNHADARYNKEYLEKQLKQLEEEEKKKKEEEEKQKEKQKEEEQKQEKQPPKPEQQEELPPEEQEKQKQEEEKKLEQLHDMLEQEKKLQEEQKKELEKQEEPPKPEEQKQPPEHEQQEPKKQEEQKPEEQKQQPESEQQKPKEEKQQSLPEKTDEQQRDEKTTEMNQEEQKKVESLERLEKQIQEEIEKKTTMQQQLQKIKNMPKEEKQINLKNMSQEITKELHKKEELANEIEKKDLKRLNELMQKENELKKKELELLDDMTKSEKKAEEEPPQAQTNQEQIQKDKEQNNMPEEQEQQKQDAQKSEKQEERQPEKSKPENPQNEAVEPPSESVIESDAPTDPFDEKAKKILNRLEDDEGNVLRYRIRQQYIRRVGE